MIISRAAQYGLIAVGYIALHQKEGKTTAHVISDEFKIPPYFLLKILTDLSGAGILLSKRGPGGGHVLAREPEKINLSDIFSAIEGSTFDHLQWPTTSNKPFFVKMKEVSNKANSEIKRVLSEATLADMIKK